jgi:hypothetical protein
MGYGWWVSPLQKGAPGAEPNGSQTLRELRSDFDNLEGASRERASQSNPRRTKER